MARLTIPYNKTRGNRAQKTRTGMWSSPQKLELKFFVLALGYTLFFLSWILSSIPASTVVEEWKNDPQDEHVIHNKNATQQSTTREWKNATTTLPRMHAEVLDRIQTYMKTPLLERPLPPNTPGAFLHVGKAGGSSLTSIMQHPCHSFIEQPCGTHWELVSNRTFKETHVGALTTYIHVPDFRTWANSSQNDSYYPDYDFYLATLRDPYTRFLSAFTFLHYRNGKTSIQTLQACANFYIGCFPTPQDFATKLGDKPLEFDYPYPPDEIVWGHNCTDLARATLANKVEVCNCHFFWTTKTILENIPRWESDGIGSSFHGVTNSLQPPYLLVIRTEHMNQDFFTASQLLGDPHPVELKDAEGYHTSRIQSPLKKVTTNMTELARTRLCRGLLPEFKAYIQALARAMNLSNQDRQQSLELSRKNCPSLDWLFLENFVE